MAEMKIERWGVFEAELAGTREGNPFLEVELHADFRRGHRMVSVRGFYDGDGTYRVRFSPDSVGDWTYATWSNRAELGGKSGRFTCVEAKEGNHGPVTVHKAFHFRYADGAHYPCVGTTSYAWIHQGDALAERTLKALAASPFDKLRMLVFPKHYRYNENEPELYPFVCTRRGRSEWTGGWKGELDRGWEFDFSRFEPAFFRNLERRIGQLCDIGVQADVILFHPYDRWGFCNMPEEVEDRYLRYVVARIAVQRNVWWSLANEWDLMQHKGVGDFERYARVLQEEDAYARLRSVHNCHQFYDHRRHWVTHCSIQSHEAKYLGWRDDYRKPVVIDELGYEGTVPPSWGSLTARELVHRFWHAACSGAYAGHSETLPIHETEMWWNKGGALRGESPRRIAFLQEILRSSEPGPWEPVMPKIPAGVCKGDAVFLYYTRDRQPSAIKVNLAEGRRYRAEVIDTWEMTITPLAEVFEGTTEVPLPSRPYMALRLTAV